MRWVATVRRVGYRIRSRLRDDDDPLSGERGFVDIVLGTIVVSGLIIGAVIVTSAVVLVGRAATEPSRVVPRGSSGFRPATFRGLPPPTENPECVQRVIAESPYKTMSYGNVGWVDSKDPAPDATSELRFAWKARIEIKAEALSQMFTENHCDRAPQPEQAATPQNQANPLEISGTYQLSLRNPATPECSGVLPATMTVSPQSTSEATLSFTGGRAEGFQPVLADLTAYSFTTEDPAQYMSIRGQFLGQEGKTIIEGVFTYNIGGGCGLSFQGTK